MQKITAQNYNKLSSIIPFSKMPKDLADTHGEMPMYLEFYGQDKESREGCSLYRNKVNQIINKPVACKPVVKTIFKDRIVPKTVYKDKIIEKVVQEPCTCEETIKEAEKSWIDKLKNPFVIGGIITGVVIGKII